MGTYKVKKGDRDCSASVIDALKTAGIPVGNATYTGNIKSEFLKTGVWAWHNMNYTAHRGDLYLKAGSHVAMCSYPVRGKTSPDMLLEFSHNESGGYYNGKVGDQLNNSANGESHQRTFYNYPWDGILTYTGSRTDLLEDAVQLMEHLVNCPEHGYTMSSPGRNGSSGYCTVITTGTGQKSGWYRAKNGWEYYVDGNAVKNAWKLVKNIWYFLKADGLCAQSEFVDWKGHKYYLAENGSMLKGWQYIDGWRYFRISKSGSGPEGSMVTGSITINGTKYDFDENGLLKS